MKIIWVLVNCNSLREAKKIGLKILNLRLGACIDIFPRLATYYFWPPKSGKIKSAQGCLLIIESLPECFGRIEKAVKEMHSDSLPFVGALEIKNLAADYLKWMKGELLL